MLAGWEGERIAVSAGLGVLKSCIHSELSAYESGLDADLIQ